MSRRKYQRIDTRAVICYARRAMVRISIREVAEKKGITNPFQLKRVTGLNYAVCHLYWNGEPKQISTDALNKLCKALGVKPGQLFDYTLDP